MLNTFGHRRDKRQHRADGANQHYDLLARLTASAELLRRVNRPMSGSHSPDPAAMMAALKAAEESLAPVGSAAYCVTSTAPIEQAPSAAQASPTHSVMKAKQVILAQSI